MSEYEILQNLEKILKESELDCSLEANVKAPPFGRLLVYLGQDAKDRERAIEITAQMQELFDIFRKTATEKKFVRVQFEIPFPFEVKDSALFDTGSLLSYLNRLSELPGFELDEMSGKIFYRYVLLSAKTDIEKEIVLGILGVIMLLMDLYGEAIEKIANGEKTFEELLQEVLKIVEPVEK